MSHDPPKVDDCHCFAARRAARRISRFYDDRLHASGLRITQFLILATLDGLGASAVNELAEKLDIERTAMGKMLGLLERDGHVAIRSSPTDGRRRLAELTAEGRSLKDEAMPLWLAAQRDFEQMNGPARGGTGSTSIGSLRGEASQTDADVATSWS